MNVAHVHSKGVFFPVSNQSRLPRPAYCAEPDLIVDQARVRTNNPLVGVSSGLKDDRPQVGVMVPSSTRATVMPADNLNAPKSSLVICRRTFRAGSRATPMLHLAAFIRT